MPVRRNRIEAEATMQAETAKQSIPDIGPLDKVQTSMEAHLK